MAKGRERSGKWYFRNENEVMSELGFTPAEGSGSGWLQKEDGENEHLIAQLKSTDKQSYSLKQLDIEKLEYHAMLAKKTPVFILQFLNKDTRYAIMAIEDIPKIAEYMETGNIQNASEGPSIDFIDEAVKPKRRKKPKIKSDAEAREEFNRLQEQQWEERKKWKR